MNLAHNNQFRKIFLDSLSLFLKLFATATKFSRVDNWVEPF